MSKFINELKRRNVIKSTIAYLVVSWILLQVFTVLLPIVSAPAWIIKVLTLIMAIGLPIWAIISWVYDLTPDGIEKTPDVSEKQVSKQFTTKRLNAFLIASLSIAVIVLTLKVSGVFSTSNDHYAIAVLPFVNMSDDSEQEYFSDGISEEIINMLAQVSKLKVMGRTSSFAYKGKNMDLKLIGEQLNVEYLLEGSVRKSGSVLRITAQLIKVEDGSHIYSNTFDRPLKDIFDIQDEISEEILKAVKIKLFGHEKEDLLKRYTDNIEAYQLYLKGRFHLNKMTPDGFLTAIEFFDKAIAIDSTYAIAYADKAFCYMNLIDLFNYSREKMKPLAIEAAEKSIELDDQIAESQLAIGRINLHWDWNVRDAKVAFEKALVLNPNSAQAHIQLGFCWVQLRNFEEAIKEANIAKDLDPLSPLNLYYVNSVFLWVKDVNTMLSISKEIIELDPNNILGHVHKFYAHLLSGQIDKALVELEKLEKIGALDFVAFGNAAILALSGENDKALAAAKELKNNKIQFFNIALIYAFLGDLDTTYYYLNEAVENRDPLILWIKFNALPEILNDPRFAELEKKIGIVY